MANKKENKALIHRFYKSIVELNQLHQVSDGEYLKAGIQKDWKIPLLNFPLLTVLCMMLKAIGL